MNAQTGARCRFWKRHRRGTEATSHSEHDERICFSQKSSEYTAPAAVIQRSKHCQTRVLGQKQASIVGQEPLPIRGGQTLSQVRRPSTISSIVLSWHTIEFPYSPPPVLVNLGSKGNLSSCRRVSVKSTLVNLKTEAVWSVAAEKTRYIQDVSRPIMAQTRPGRHQSQRSNCFREKHAQSELV